MTETATAVVRATAPLRTELDRLRSKLEAIDGLCDGALRGEVPWDSDHLLRLLRVVRNAAAAALRKEVQVAEEKA